MDKLSLKNKDWKDFYLSDFFDFEKGNQNNMASLTTGTLPLVSAKKTDNGYKGFVSKEQKKIFRGDILTLNNDGDGGAGIAYYQPTSMALDSHVSALIPKSDLNKYHLLFVSMCITKQRERFGHGYSINGNRLRAFKIMLPLAADCTNPDWQFMENYIKSLHYKPLTTKHTTALKLNKDRWQEFEFGRLIKSIYKAHAYTKDDLTEQNVKLDSTLRYITRTAEDNGCELIVKNKAISYVEEGNAITIGDTTATCFYQEEKFVTGDHMIVVRANWLNTYTGLFIVTLLNNEQYRYSYGRAFLMDRVKETVLKLPICRNNDGLPIIDEAKRFSDEGFIPDWQFMEDYIKSLPYGDRI